MTQAIRVEGVHKRFGDLHALKGVSFGIEQGEYFGLLGPNGAGKSTLINITAGLVRASQGQVSVMGQLLELSHYHHYQLLQLVLLLLQPPLRLLLRSEIRMLHLKQLLRNQQTKVHSLEL